MNLREIKSKIKSNQRISHVTKALQMVSAVKMRKAQKMALDSRPFAQKVMNLLKKLAEYQEKYGEMTPFYFGENKESNKILVVVSSSDKGFCGNFNNNLLRFAEHEVSKLEKGSKQDSSSREIEVFPIGKKANNFFKKKEFPIKAEFNGMGDYGEFNEIKPVADVLINYFETGEYRKIYLFWTDFISSFLQKPRKAQLLPIKSKVYKKLLENSPVYESEDKKYSQDKEEGKILDYIFEPSVKEVYNNLSVQMIEHIVYHSILENNASEHSARMIAMKNAHDNATELIDNLTLKYNKVRQNQITSEVCEINSARQALE